MDPRRHAGVVPLLRPVRGPPAEPEQRRVRLLRPGQPGHDRAVRLLIEGQARVGRGDEAPRPVGPHRVHDLPLELRRREDLRPVDLDHPRLHRRDRQRAVDALDHPDVRHPPEVELRPLARGPRRPAAAPGRAAPRPAPCPARARARPRPSRARRRVRGRPRAPRRPRRPERPRARKPARHLLVAARQRREDECPHHRGARLDHAATLRAALCTSKARLDGRRAPLYPARMMV